MNSYLIANAGLGSFAAVEQMVMNSGMLIIGLIAFRALSIQSRTLAITSLVLLALFSVVCQPWFLFGLDPEVYESGYLHVGIGWVLTSMFVAWTTVVAWGKPESVQKETEDQDVSPQTHLS